MKKWLTILGLTLAGTATPALATVARDYDAPETVFDYEQLISTPLEPRTLKRTVKGSIVTEEVMFHSENDNGRDIDIFAFYSYPKPDPKKPRKFPAFVWNQGGLSQASAFRTEMGAKRGYATLCIDFPQPGYRSTGNYAINTGVEVGSDPRRAPIYHGAVALLKAVSYLAARPEVDAERIGMAGSSWGGFYTTLMIGIDPRLKVGACMYGAGNMQMGNMWWDEPKTDMAPELAARSASRHSDPAFREHWRVTLDPAFRLARSRTPLAWFTGTNDWFYWMPSVMQTHNMATGPRHLSLVPNWDHVMPSALVEQTFAWLDTHLKGKPAFSQVTPLTVGKRNGKLVAQWKWSGPRRAVAADLILSCGAEGNWHSRYWKKIPVTLKGNICEAALPLSKLPYYISGAITDKDKFRYSTPLLKVSPADYGIDVSHSVPLVPDYNGCGEWGGFEKAQIAYLKQHRLPVPPLSRVAKEGKRSAVLYAGRATLPYILFTPGVPHRFTAYLKSNKKAKIALKLYGKFGGREVGVQQHFDIKRRWTKVTLEFTPPAAPEVMKPGSPRHLGGESGLPEEMEKATAPKDKKSLVAKASGAGVRKLPRRAWFAATFSVPKGITARLDAVSFRPVAPKTITKKTSATTVSVQSKEVH